MITIRFNGSNRQFAATTVAELIHELGDYTACSAIAINKQFIPRANYATTPLQSGDELELVVPMQGG